MGRIAKWLDSTFLPSVNDGRLDYSILPDEVKLASEVFLVTILNDDTSLPAADRWTDSWTAEDVDGHQIVNVYTSFDKALAEYWRLSEAHPDSIMRVERRNLESIISGKPWTAKLIGVYDEECYLCDGKTAYPEDYWKRWPNQYPEEAKEKGVEIKRPIGFVVPEAAQAEDEEKV